MKSYGYIVLFCLVLIKVLQIFVWGFAMGLWNYLLQPKNQIKYVKCSLAFLDGMVALSTLFSSLFLKTFILFTHSIYSLPFPVKQGSEWANLHKTVLKQFYKTANIPAANRWRIKNNLVCTPFPGEKIRMKPNRQEDEEDGREKEGRSRMENHHHSQP